MQLSECDRDVDVDVILRDAGTRGEWIAGYTDRSGRDRVRKRKKKGKSKRDDSRGILSYFIAGLLVSFSLSQLSTIE